MDAQELKPRSDRFSRPWVVRAVGVCLVIVLVVGLWQGYGVWLLGGRRAG